MNKKPHNKPQVTPSKCVKKKFQTEVEVLMIVQDNREKKNRGNEKRNEIRYYKCWQCKAFHLTSQIMHQRERERENLANGKS